MRNVLHIHGYTTFTNDDWLFTERAICLVCDSGNLQRKVVPYSSMTPIEGLQGKHSLKHESISYIETKRLKTYSRKSLYVDREVSECLLEERVEVVPVVPVSNLSMGKEYQYTYQ